jgi:steroid delta-isomerase-like uncharacterized protein
MSSGEAAMNRNDIEKLVERWAQVAMAEGRVEVFDEVLAEDVHDVSAGAGSHGRESFKARARAVRDAFSDRSIRVEALVVEGDRVAWRWTLRGVHSGKFLGVEPTGKTITLSGVNFQRVRDGRVVEHWTLADAAGILRQLG